MLKQIYFISNEGGWAFSWHKWSQIMYLKEHFRKSIQQNTTSIALQHIRKNENRYQPKLDHELVTFLWMNCAFRRILPTRNQPVGL